MGTIKQLTCKGCGAEWHRFEGSGMMVTNYYCNNCNSQYTRDNPIREDYTPPMCDCGGEYLLKPINNACPECNSSETIIKDVGLWD